MRRLLILACALAAVQAAPASAGAPVSGLKLISARGALTISEDRCPTGGGACGHVKLSEQFVASPPAKARWTATGTVVSGTGTGSCNADSPPKFVVLPDGSQQFLAGAERLDPGKFGATNLSVTRARRGVRWTWLEPTAPQIDCTYFDEQTPISVPGNPAGLSSAWFTPAALKRAQVVVPIAGSSKWAGGSASWSLTLVYAVLQKPRFTG